MDLDLYRTFGGAATIGEVGDVAVAALTNLGCVCLFAICFTWWLKLLRSETTDLGWWFFGTAIIALALFSWSLKGLRIALDPNRDLPNDTLYERIGVMTAVWVKIWIATRRKPLPRWSPRKPREMIT